MAVCSTACGSDGEGKPAQGPELHADAAADDRDGDAGDGDGRDDGGAPLRDAEVAGDGDSGAKGERYPATGDNDGDGLRNDLERALHTDPEYADTDGDGVSDGDEVGPDTAAPRDSDKDGFPDVLEHARLDNDNDNV